MSSTAYPQQGWSAQPPTPPQPAAWSAPTHPGPKTNLLSILAISAAAAGTTVLLGIGSCAAIVLGFIALAQIKRTGDDGRLLAVWSIVVGVVTLLALIVSTVLGISAFVSFVQDMPELTGP